MGKSAQDISSNIVLGVMLAVLILAGIHSVFSSNSMNVVHATACLEEPKT